MDEALGSLSPTWEIWIALNFALTRPWLLLAAVLVMMKIAGCHLVKDKS